MNERFFPTKRKFRDVETGETFALYMNQETHEYKLISEGSKECAKGTEVNGFYIASCTAATIKLNTGKQVFVNSGEFYHLKESERATHRKFIGFNRFSKI